MLSINDIKTHQFRAKGGNYRAVDVDEYYVQIIETLDALAAAYEKAKRDNDELYRKISILSNKIEQYRKDEDSIRITLLTAQKMADNVTNDTKLKAQSIIDEAKKTASDTIGSIKSETDEYVRKNVAEADEYVKKSVAEANEYLRKSKDEYSLTIETVNEKARFILESANKNAQNVLKDAQDRAREILNLANTQSKNISDDIRKKIDNAENRLSFIMRITSQLKASVTEVMQKEIDMFSTVELETAEYKAYSDVYDFHFDETDINTPEFTPEPYIPIEETPAVLPEDDAKEDAEAEVEITEDISSFEVSEEKAEENTEEAQTEAVNDEVEEPEITEDEEKPQEAAVEAENDKAEEPAEPSSEETETSEPKQEEVETEEVEEAPVKEEKEAEKEPEKEPVKEEKAKKTDDDTKKYTREYIDNIMKELATPDIDISKAKGKKNQSLFDQLEKGDPAKRVTLSTGDEELKFGKDFDIFNDGFDDNQGGFFGRFKKK